MNIKRYIQQITNDRKTLVDFLADDVQGNTQHATVSHRLRSVEWLAVLGGFIPETAAIPSKNKNSAPSRLCDKKTDRKPPVTEKRNTANTPAANPMPRAIHATDIDENTVVFSHEPLSIEEWKRLRKTLAHPDNIPANARSP